MKKLPLDEMRDVHIGKQLWMTVDFQYQICYGAFIFSMILSADIMSIGKFVAWSVSLDSIRLTYGLTSIIRIVIVHAKGKTMMMNAGFFSYILFNTNNTNLSNITK